MAREKLLPERVEGLQEEWTDLVLSTSFGGGELSYWKSDSQVVEVVDREGRSFQPRWSGLRTELFPGVEVFTRGTASGRASEDRCLRIHRSACPVRVLVRRTYEVRHYEDYQHDGAESERQWIRYEVGAT